MSTPQNLSRPWNNPKIAAEGKKKRFKLILKYHKIEENKIYHRIKVIRPFKQTLKIFSDLTTTPKLPKKVKMTPKVQKKLRWVRKEKSLL